jgi:hypothetical protein
MSRIAQGSALYGVLFHFPLKKNSVSLASQNSTFSKVDGKLPTYISPFKLIQASFIENSYFLSDLFISKCYFFMTSTKAEIECRAPTFSPREKHFDQRAFIYRLPEKRRSSRYFNGVHRESALLNIENFCRTPPLVAKITHTVREAKKLEPQNFFGRIISMFLHQEYMLTGSLSATNT